MAYIGQAPANKVVSASDLEDGIITNSKLAQDIISAETELATAPADTDEFLISDAGTLKRIDASLVGGKDFASLLSASSGSAVSEVVFDDLDVSTYSHFKLVWFSRPSVDDAFLYFQMRTGGSSGSNFTSSYYDSAVFGTNSSALYTNHEINADHWRVHQNCGNGGSTEYHQSQMFFTPRKSSYQNYHGNFLRSQGTRYDSGTAFRPEISCGAYNHSDTPNATGFRIYYHSGNIEDYDYKLYGIVSYAIYR